MTMTTRSPVVVVIKPPPLDGNLAHTALRLGLADLLEHRDQILLLHDPLDRPPAGLGDEHVLDVSRLFLLDHRNIIHCRPTQRLLASQRLGFAYMYAQAQKGKRAQCFLC
jgi:hypothetical protein